MTEHINTKRAHKRNGLKGSMYFASSSLKTIIKSNDIFSPNEILDAKNALYYIQRIITAEPKNYISLRYNSKILK